MTDEERKQAEQQARLISNHHEANGFMKGYAAACDSKRQRWDMINELKLEEVLALQRQLDIERARSAKLLKHIKDSRLKNKRASDADADAIGEYEASR